MNKRLFLALVALLVAFAGGFQLVRAQQTQQTQQLKGAKDLPVLIPAPQPQGPPPFTVKGTYYGFLTDNKDRRLGSKATPDQIKAAVAAGAYYVLGGTKVEPAEEAAKYAGQWVTMKALYTSTAYATGTTSDPSIEGYGAGQACSGCPAAKVHSMKIISIKLDAPPNDDGHGVVAQGSGEQTLDVIPASTNAKGEVVQPALSPESQLQLSTPDKPKAPSK